MPVCKQNCGSQIQWMAKVHCKILHKIRNSQQTNLPLWVNNKIFLFHSQLTGLRTTYSGLKLNIYTWKWYLYGITPRQVLSFWHILPSIVEEWQVWQQSSWYKVHHFDSESPHFTKLFKVVNLFLPKAKIIENETLSWKALHFISTLCIKHLAE